MRCCFIFLDIYSLNKVILSCLRSRASKLKYAFVLINYEEFSFLMDQASWFGQKNVVAGLLAGFFGGKTKE